MEMITYCDQCTGRFLGRKKWVRLRGEKERAMDFVSVVAGGLYSADGCEIENGAG